MANEWQVESVYAEGLANTTPAGQVETVYAEVLFGPTATEVIESVYAEMLAANVTVLVVENLYTEVLAPVVPPSNLYDSTGTMLSAYLWDGAALQPVVFTAG